MTIIIFILILALLIFVHELGHFLAAKWAGARVDEFALGFPPKIFSYTYGETKYVLNLIPFGGYVKIFGEDPNESSLTGPDKDHSLVNKPKHRQAIVLLAGVTFNMLLAWVLFSLAFLIGFPVSGKLAERFPGGEAVTVITAVSPESPAAKAGLESGDTLVYVRNGSGDKVVVKSPDDLKPIINRIAPRPISVGVAHDNNEVTEIKITPARDVVPGGGWALGIGFEQISVVEAPWHQVPWLGFVMTYDTTIAMVVGLYDLVQQVAGGLSLREAVVGPVGIAGMVGDASDLGLVYLITFTAFISINLAVLNLVPFPALDGGRLFFLLIETIKGSRLNPTIANTFNLVGFVLLISFMLYVTWGDIVRLWQ